MNICVNPSVEYILKHALHECFGGMYVLHKMQNLEGDMFHSRQLAKSVVTYEDYINNKCCSELIDIGLPHPP